MTTDDKPKEWLRGVGVEEPRTSNPQNAKGPDPVVEPEPEARFFCGCLPPRGPEPLCSCGKPGKLCNDPYVEELHGIVEEVVLCDDCYHESCMDI